MKKKNIAISKKLSFNKETIAALNGNQQQLINGGAIPITRLVNCTSGMETCGGETCATIQRPGGPCELCPILQ